MATPEKPTEAPEKKPGKASAAKKRGKKSKAMTGTGRRKGEKSAREWAVEYLKRHKGRAKFGVLTNWVSEKMGGNLSWTPTYYMDSPGFSRPERGVVAYSETEAVKGRAAIAEARKERLSKTRPKKKAGKKEAKAKKAPKKETILERRQRTAREKAEREANDKADFDEAVKKADKEEAE